MQAIETIPYLLEKLDFTKFSPTKLLLISPKDQSTALRLQLSDRYPQAMFDRLTGDIKQFPVKNDYYDLIVAHWLPIKALKIEDPALLFYLLHHFLAPAGAFLFSSPGPEPLQVLGDLLLKAGYQDPVMDRDNLILDEQPLELFYGLAWKAAGQIPIRQVPIRQIIT